MGRASSKTFEDQVKACPRYPMGTDHPTPSQVFKIATLPETRSVLSLQSTVLNPVNAMILENTRCLKAYGCACLSDEWQGLSAIEGGSAAQGWAPSSGDLLGSAAFRGHVIDRCSQMLRGIPIQAEGVGLSRSLFKAQEPGLGSGQSPQTSGLASRPATRRSRGS